MMADTGIGRILRTEVISPIQSYDRGTGSLHEDVGASALDVDDGQCGKLSSR
jgi:hypothetical protein